MNRLLRLSLLSALALTGCHGAVTGNGVLGEEQRPVAPFDAVDISLGIEAFVTANAAAQQVVISGDENLLQFVLTPVEGGVLSTQLHGTSGIEPVHPIQLAVKATALHSVRAHEAAAVDVKDAGDPAPGFTFEVVAAEASQVQLQGTGGHQLTVNLSGASRLDAWSYPAAAASVLVSGASVLRIHAAADVTGSASGASVVEITGGGTCAALVLSTGATCTVR